MFRYRSTRSGPSRVSISPPHLRSRRPKKLLGFVEVMSPAPQLHVVGSARTSYGEGRQMMKLQKVSLGAAAFLADESATSLVACPHFPPHRCRNPARTWRHTGGPTRTKGRSRSRAFELLNQQPQRTADDRSSIAAGDGVTQQLLGSAQVVVRLAR